MTPTDTVVDDPEIIYTAAFDIRPEAYDELKRWLVDVHMRELVDGGFTAAASYERTDRPGSICDVYAVPSLSLFESDAYRRINPASGHPRRGTQTTSHQNTTYRIIQQDIDITWLPAYMTTFDIQADADVRTISALSQLCASRLAANGERSNNESGFRLLCRHGKHPHYDSQMPNFRIMIGWHVEPSSADQVLVKQMSGGLYRLSASGRVSSATYRRDAYEH